MSSKATFASVCGTVSLFSLVGPLVAGVLAPLMFLLGGPLGLLMYPVYLILWLPAIYTLLAPPFFLTGILCAMAQRRLPLTLPVVLVATLISWVIYIGLRFLLTSTVAIPTPGRLDFGTDPASTAWVVATAFAATIAVWCLHTFIRPRIEAFFSHRFPYMLASFGQVCLMVISIAVVAGSLALSRPPPPKTAWDRCVDADNRYDQVRDCTTALDAQSETLDRRIQALDSRMTAYSQLAAIELDKKAQIKYADHEIEDTLTLQNQFGKEEKDWLIGAYMRRAGFLVDLGNYSRAREDYQAAIRLDPNTDHVRFAETQLRTLPADVR